MASWLTTYATLGRSPPRWPPKKGWLKSAPSILMLLLMPRAPPKLSWLRSFSWYTPGVKKAKSKNLRPLSGRFDTWFVSTTLLASEREVSISGGGGGVSTVVFFAAGFRGTLPPDDCPRRTEV